MDEKKKILLIDDEPEIQDLLTLFMKIRGFDGYIAENGEEGIKMAAEILPDLILLDIMMPKVDGFKVQQALKNRPDTERIPIIFITAKIEPMNAEKAIVAGAKAYLEKPFDLDTLTQTIHSVLGAS